MKPLAHELDAGLTARIPDSRMLPTTVIHTTAHKRCEPSTQLKEVMSKLYSNPLKPANSQKVAGSGQFHSGLLIKVAQTPVPSKG